MKKNTVSLRRIVCIIIAGLFYTSAAVSASDRGFSNPYRKVNWETVQHYDANFHTHTKLSDGHLTPHQAIDEYKALGYSILALTDHDSHHFKAHPESLYPWNSINSIYEQIKDKPRSRGNTTYAETAGNEWQNRDPAELEMVAIQGSEISNTDHIGSYFNKYAGGTGSEETAIKEIGNLGGLAVFFHPGRYKRDTEWYVRFYRENKHLIGMEVYNQIDRYPGDREIWDRVLHHLMPERPVWGFANDDMHRLEHLGRNRNVMLLPELSSEAVRYAMEHGHFFFFVPVERGGKPAVRITKVKAEEDRLGLVIDGTYTEVDWVTHNPDENKSVTIGRGPDLKLEDVPEYAVYVRAQITGDDGRFYTQPFGIFHKGE